MDLSLVRVLNRYDEVASFLHAVGAASDAHRNLLGFVRRGIFEEFARRNDLLVLVTHKDDNNIEYVGHLLFARRYPRASVLQLLVLPQYRGKKFGRLLCNRLVELLTHDGFTSIYARVGEDMRNANEAWQAMGFRVQRVEPGGVTTGRTIVVRVRGLASPQLFPTHTVDQADPLGLARTLSTETPLFLVDLNVLFDLSPHRGRHEEALMLFHAERANFCKLAISDEIIAELTRTGSPGRPDPMMNLARTFTRFPVSSATANSPIVLELASLVFPSKGAANLSRNEISDLRHLVTAIENSLAGLVTNDQAILRAGQEIEARFGVQVLSPKSFLPDEPTAGAGVAYEASHLDLELQPTTGSDDAEVRLLLGKLGVTPTDLASGWSSRISTNHVVRSGLNVVAYMSRPGLRHDSITVIRAAVDETHSNAMEAARGIIMQCLSNVDGPTTLQLKTPRDQVLLRDIARGVGFCDGRGTNDLTKLVFGRVATKGNWNRKRAELAEISGLKMDGHFPRYRRMEQQVPYVTRSGDHRYETLERIETLLSPALFCFPGRPAVITPILHKYAQLLLGHSQQGSLLPAPASNLFQERRFISGPNAFNQLKRGTLMLFYESSPPRGKGELVCIARVRRSYLKDIATVQDSDLKQSVLSQETLTDIGRAQVKTITVFDNVFALPTPISLQRLQELDCGRPIDLITTRAISDTQLQEILAEAFKE